MKENFILPLQNSLVHNQWLPLTFSFERIIDSETIVCKVNKHNTFCFYIILFVIIGITLQKNYLTIDHSFKNVCILR